MNRLLSIRAKTPEYYDGILVHADPGVHPMCESVLHHHAPPPARVLDLGAGAGALSRRLHRAGYDVTAVDMDASEWQAPEVRFIQGDATSPITAMLGQTEFDAICCLEVIEHVENQSELLRQAYAVCRPGGHLIVTTPNITSFLSRAIFLLRGRFHQFDDADLSYGHISPITAWELKVLAERAGWMVREIRPAGILPLIDLAAGWRSIPMNLMRVICRLLARHGAEGWCILAVLQKAP